MWSGSQTIPGCGVSRRPGSQALRAFYVKQGIWVRAKLPLPFGARLAHAAAAPRTDRKVASSPESFRCESSAAGVEMRFAIDAPDPGATNPDPVVLK